MQFSGGKHISVCLFSTMLASIGVIAATAQDQPGDEGVLPMYDVVETTISDVHAAYADGSLTAVALTQIYLDRIAEYDAAINAFIVLNQNAPDRAAELDAEYAETSVLRPLHGIPLVVKDNYDTADLPTTGGSAALAGLTAPDDAARGRNDTGGRSWLACCRPVSGSISLARESTAEDPRTGIALRGFRACQS